MNLLVEGAFVLSENRGKLVETSLVQNIYLLSDVDRYIRYDCNSVRRKFRK